MALLIRAESTYKAPLEVGAPGKLACLIPTAPQVPGVKNKGVGIAA